MSMMVECLVACSFLSFPPTEARNNLRGQVERGGSYSMFIDVRLLRIELLVVDQSMHSDCSWFFMFVTPVGEKRFISEVIWTNGVDVSNGMLFE